MPNALAALLSLTPFAREQPEPGTLCAECLSDDVREELAALAWGRETPDDPEDPPAYF